MTMIDILKVLGIDLDKIEDRKVRELMCDIFINYVFESYGSNTVTFEINRFQQMKEFVENHIRMEEMINEA